jgi:hypothetical protein
LTHASSRRHACRRRHQRRQALQLFTAPRRLGLAGSATTFGITLHMD